MKTLKTWLCAAGSLAALVVWGGAVQADHRLANPLVALSEDLRCQADDLRDSFRDQFRQSAVYIELMRKSQEIKNAANRVRSLARSNGCPIRIGNEVDAMERLIFDMMSLVDVARLRAARGLDKPLCGCTLHIDNKLARMRQTVFSMKRFLVGGRGFDRRQNYDYGYGYGGQREYRGSPGHSWDFDDRRTGSYIDPGVAINGPRGRGGVEFGLDGGIVLNIGGAGVRLR